MAKSEFSSSFHIRSAGVRAAIFFTRAENRLLLPGLACALPGHRAAGSLLKRAFDKNETALAAWLCQEKLAT
jgi:hypothetical protein